MQDTHGTFLFPNQCTSWIRGSSGHLCIELKPKGTPQPSIPLSRFSKPKNMNLLLRTSSEAAALSALLLGEYHALCFRRYISQTRRISCTENATVKLGAIIRYSTSVEIAMLPQPSGVEMHGWHAVAASVVGEVMSNSWTRFAAGDLPGVRINSFSTLHHWKAWLSQANRIFSQLRIKSDHEDYMLVDSIDWECKIFATAHCPDGYLFACPMGDFQCGPCSFGWPKLPVYWSLDPLGVERLTAEEAQSLGFPSFQIAMSFWGRY
ncbi:hypothetical protein C8R45DRAFT_547173 [Mycena sanguinolenta]|nr:hypothetical protein C8R45DRAFT_547173 [Mycena sanguinolenta]